MIDDKRFSEIADAVPFPMWRSDALGACTLLNAAWCELTGTSPLQGLGDGWLECVHPDDRNELRRQFENAARRGTAYQAEYRLKGRDGDFGWVADSATPRYSDNGELVGFVGTLVNIGDRKESELRLERAERRLRIAMAAAGIGVWEWDLAGDRLLFTPRALEIFGLEGSEIVTQELLATLIHPDDLPDVQNASRRALDPSIREITPYRYRITRAVDGEVRWIRAHGEAEFNESGSAAVRYIGTFEDVTEDHLASARLLEQEAKLRIAMQAAGLVLWEFDLERDRVTPSAELNRLFGFPDNMEPTPQDLRGVYAEGEVERLQRLGEEASARGETSLTTELKLALPGGTERWLLLLAQSAPPTNEGGRRVIGVLMDITERKREEQRLATVARELQHRVKNMLTITQSLASQTFRNIPECGPHLDSFSARLRAMATAAETLTQDGGTAAEVAEVIEGAVQPYASDSRSRFAITGPDLVVDSHTAVALAMALHELCTNAVKYGALSSEDGSIELHWTYDADQLEVAWTERDGPPVTAPERKGFGSRLLAGLFPMGNVDLEFDPSGLRCKIVTTFKSR